MPNKQPPRDKCFKPGQSGNPGGIPKGKRISTWMVQLGQMQTLPDPSTLPINGKIALARIKRALMPRGGEYSTEIVLNRTEGPVKQIHELRSDLLVNKTPQEIGRALLKDGAPSEPPGTGTEPKRE